MATHTLRNYAATCHYGLFSFILRLKKVMNKGAFFCFNADFVCLLWEECKSIAI